MLSIWPVHLTFTCFCLIIWRISCQAAPGVLNSFHKLSVQAQITNAQIIRSILSSYELHSHIDIILVGFNKYPEIFNGIIERLNKLSSAKFVSAPYQQSHKFHEANSLFNHKNISLVQEKTLFFLSLSHPKFAEKLLGLYSKEFSATDVEAVLAEDFERRSSQNALYIIAEPVPLSWTKLNCPPLFSRGYKSSLKLFSWFYLISDDGFDSVISGSSHISSYPKIKSLDAITITSMTTLIVRASEALNPNPVTFDFDTTAAAHVKTVTLLIVKLCYDELFSSGIDLCKDKEDDSMKTVSAQLTEVYFSLGIKLIQSTVSLSLRSNIDIASALQYSSSQSENFVNVSTKSLLGRLSKSSTWKGLLSEYAESARVEDAFSERLLPVIEVLSSQRRLVLDSTTGISSVGSIADELLAFDPWHIARVDGVHLLFDEDASSIANGLQWPSEALVVVNGVDLKVTKQIFCKNTTSNVDFTKKLYFQREIYDQVQSAVWGIAPKRYFSQLSSLVIEDINWSMTESKEYLKASAYDKRTLAKHIVFYRIEALFDSFSDLVERIEGNIPGLNISVWMKSRTIDETFSGKSKAFSIPTSTNGHQIFNRFLSTMDEAATAYAHGDYNECLNYIQNANVLVSGLKQSLDAFAKTVNWKVILNTDGQAVPSLNNIPSDIKSIPRNGSPRNTITIVLAIIGVIIGLTMPLPRFRTREHLI